MAYVKVQGFAPDAEFATAELWTDCDLLVPTLRGFQSLEKGVSVGGDTAPSSICSVVSFRNQDYSNRTLAGSKGTASAASSSLYDVTGTAWTNINGASGPYTATPSARWTWAIYNDAVFAAQKGTQLLKQPQAGADFTVVTGAPQATIAVSVLDQIVCFNTVDATYGDSPNRWWCSAAGNPLGGDNSWTADIATQATTGLLTDGPGPIVAAGRVGSNLVAFKLDHMYIGQYVGTPEVWGWARVPGDGLGTWGSHSVADVEGVGLLFPGRDNFYIFDGSRAQPIGTNRVAQFFISDLDTDFADVIVAFHDRETSRVFWHYPSTSGGLNIGVLDRYLCYNYRADTWTYGRKTIAFPFSYVVPGTTYGELGSHYTTWADLPAATYDRAFASANSYIASYVSPEGEIFTYTGTGENSYYETGYAGQDGLIMAHSRTRPRFMVAPTTGTARHDIVDQLGASPTTIRSDIEMTNGAFDHVYAGRWHRMRHSFTGSMELTGYDVEFSEFSLE